MKVAAIDVKTNTRITGGVDIDELHKSAGLACISSHAWLQDKKSGEVLLQQRSQQEGCYPYKFDISLAGHLDGDEDAKQAILREGMEEGGVDLSQYEPLRNLCLYQDEEGDYRGRNYRHNQFIYLYRILVEKEDINLIPQYSEVARFDWRDLGKFLLNIINPKKNNMVPHSKEYYKMIARILTNDTNTY